MAETQESNIVRIVNIEEALTEAVLKQLIQNLIQPKGNIEKMYIKKDDKLGINYAYLLFEYSDDALKASQNLNGYIYNANKFDVALIGPGLEYKKYNAPLSRSTVLESSLLKRVRGQSTLSLRFRQIRNNIEHNRQYLWGKNYVKPNESTKPSTDTVVRDVSALVRPLF